MSELIKTFVIVMTLSGATFWIVKVGLPEFLPAREFRRWCLVWLALITAAFFANSIWVLMAVVAVFCIVFVPSKAQDRVIYFLLLLCAIPLLPAEIPGFGLMNRLFVMNYSRMLVILLLFTLWLKRKDSTRLFKLRADRYIVCYVMLNCFLSFRSDSFTNALRESFLFFIDIFIPYYVVSRKLDNINQLNKAFVALLIGFAPFAAIGIFETLTHWHVFNVMKKALSGVRGGSYILREGSLRASAIFASPIVLGYVMVIGFGLLLYLQPLIKSRFAVKMAGIALVGSLLATMARGPWIGLVFLCFCFAWVGKDGMKKITLWTFIGVMSLPLLSLTETGKKFINLLPFIGEAKSDTIDYRVRLIQNGMIVFKRNPWFGSTTFLDTPEMESMRQGQGIIDLVNSYIQVGLTFGIVGLALFIAIFASLLWRCYVVLKHIPPSETDLHRMGRALFAILASIVLMIGTVSSIDYIPVFYWVFAGIVAGYLSLAEKTIRQYRAEKLNLNLGQG